MISRLAGIFLCALPAVRELYQYVHDPRFNTELTDEEKLTTIVGEP